MPDTAVTSLTDVRVLRAIELIWREADLLDRKEYAAWNALYADDGVYVPRLERVGEPGGEPLFGGGTRRRRRSLPR